ncbi:nuclear pore complex protein NUP98A-like isoform X4 [Primulina eburnea]|uniref:nuclear pore complex protein NUP98A-like isoform X4 n=1 Tax=Primulina eburnea TaxID=1245227 RepID=UPI003C6C383E
MFGSNPFGQSSSSPFGSQPAFGQTTNASNNPFGSSSSPFGSQPAFGQTTNASNNPFAPKPFGSTSPFGSQTGGSIFGGMSTGVFGAQSSSPLGSASVFGASSSPAFGSSTPAFGVSSASAFGNSSSAFGGSGVFGQKPSFGGFGSNTTQTSPFGSSFQQTQPAFGNNLFGSSTPFGAPSQPAFGSTSSPAFGASSTPGFGATSSPAFGSTASPTFGSTSGGFGSSTSPFGSSTPAFGSITTPAFGATATPAFGATATPAFGATATPAFGPSTTSAFGASSSPFNFGSSPAFGQSAAVFGSTPFGTLSSSVQDASFGAQTTASTFGGSGFGLSAFGGQRGGSRLAPYSSTPETDGATGTQPAGKIESISAMPVYKDKSHEELRWEDYQLGDKGGPAPAGQSTTALGFGTSSFGLASAPVFAQSSATPFSSAAASNPFAPKTTGVFGGSGFGSSPSSTFGSSPFATSNTSNPFGSTISATSSLFGSTAQTSGVGTSPSIFGNSSTSPFGSPSIFGPTSSQGTSSAFNTGLGFPNTQSSPLFQSNMSTLTPASSPFAQTSSAFGQTTPGFSQTNLFSTPSTGFGGNMFSSTPSLLSNTNPLGFGQTTPSLSSPFQLAQPPQSSGGFSFSNFGQSQAVGTSSFGGTPGIFSQSALGQLSAPQSAVGAQSSPIVNPFGTLPALPQISIGRTGTSPSIQYGISSLPIVEKPVPVRMSLLLTPRHLSQRRVRLPVRKYDPKIDGPKVPFFHDGDETPSTPKADALFIPRENPRALVIRPLDQWPSRASAEKTTQSKASGAHAYENGKLQNDVSALINGHKVRDKDASPAEHSVENGVANEQVTPVKRNPKSNVVLDGRCTDKGDSYITLGSHRAGEAAIVFEHGADIEALMPKLRHSDYYTEPRMQELAAKERAEPGFCRNVKDFIVGRHGYGSIKFFGETDVRKLDLESLVQFNNREVIVYMDESKKPPIGQGLNKPAEVTLLNIKCFDKKTGQQYTEGPRIERYKEMLKRKAEDQGAEFVSYNPMKGEWKFRVNHFSMYKLGNDEDENDDNLLNTMR